MAWTAGGNGGSVEIGGTLTPETVVLPWEVKTGSNIADLNAKIKKGQSEVDIVASKAIPVLGIRTIESTFQGQPGISPRINFGGAINAKDFSQSVTTLTLDVISGDNKIGKMQVPFFAGAMISKTGTKFSKLWSAYATGTDRSFFGGLPTSADATSDSVAERIAAVFPESIDKFDNQGITESAGVGNSDFFSDSNYIYSAFYGSGIEKDQTIKITLDSPAESDAITWKASLPVVVSYQ
ncbi:hypothetical protein WK433_004984 [Escherichia coli]|nr:hypothetical protein [Escherichia coli]